MTDSLRDRIAAAITDGIIAGDGHGKIADAVIESLDSQGWLVSFPSPDEPGWINDESRCLKGDDDK
jgi:hypothetical protein